jgi:RNA polymerase sigma-70 factor (ECF subfamily)
LYLRYAKRLHGLATAQTGADLNARLDPEDIVQSIFRTFFRRAYEGHYEVPDGEELWKLFLVIGLHKIRDAAAFHRAGKRSVDRTIGMSFSSGDLDPAAPDGFAEQTLRLVIDDLLKSLSESQREIIILRLDGAQMEEIAAKTQRSLRTVERTLQKFRELLRLQIDETTSKGDASE